MTPNLNFWCKFRDSFKQELELMPDEHFKHAWLNSSKRTKLYENQMFEKVASKLNLVYKKEEFKIDYTLCQKCHDGYNVPLVFIESENDASTAHHEMRKLCCLSAPLKVLITCVEWCDEPGAWRHGGEKGKLLSTWSKQIKSHASIWLTPSVTGIIVAEWNKNLRFYCLAFNQLGEIVDEHQIFYERDIG